MRLTKIKLSGFKSFVDPTTVTFPSNLTGVVGPNGCGKSNVIDAVRWVMGELSAKHLRGESMSDVIFNGSSTRKPVGKASVELVFDNSDAKISGPYAAYGEVSLRREVLRDGTSAYFINGGRCRRKDITQLFLGTGLGSRSYAIIEQGMISRVIEARPEDLRAFVEEAAGISRYKERRRETESRIADARENLERLQDLRDEIDKQIRHLQRQAASARRYQALKEDERRLAAELLALRLRELDRGGDLQSAELREREIAMEAALAELRSAEASIEKQRVLQADRSERVQACQGRFYAVGAEISRGEQQLAFARETLDRRRHELEQAREQLGEIATHVTRDEDVLAALRQELEQLSPGLEDNERREAAAAEHLGIVETELVSWQSGWEEFNRQLGAAHQTVQVERARIEQLENQARRLQAQSDRIAIEQEALRGQASGGSVEELAVAEERARELASGCAAGQEQALNTVQAMRARQLEVERELEAARVVRERHRAEVLSVEALQRAALGKAEGTSAAWLASTGLASRPRIAESLVVDHGWERAVETVLGDYLEALCVDGLEELGDSLAGDAPPGLALFETGAGNFEALPSSLALRVKGPSGILELLGAVRTTDSLAQALASRRALGPGESCVTPRGEWVGRGWLRVPRGADPHAGVLEREHRLKSLRADLAAADADYERIDASQRGLRVDLATAEAARDAAQAAVQQSQREHAEAVARLQAGRLRAEEAQRRLERIEQEAQVVAREQQDTQGQLGTARSALDQGLLELDRLDGRRPALESEREERRLAVAEARAAAQLAQSASRDLLIRVEGRRSAESAAVAALRRMAEQRGLLAERARQLEEGLAEGDAPIVELQRVLDAHLQQRVEVEAELAGLRAALDEADVALRRLDESRLIAERRVGEAREATDRVRLAAQETRVRREGLLEQFAATQLVLTDVTATLPETADLADWEMRLAGTRADIERLGQVNLAAIDELAQNTERKEYLDRQFADLTSALETLEQAMRRIDKETRSRFDETFERINNGLKQKFPQLFGGGHAYLELVGEDPLAAGVSIMARPPGKRNVSISQLSGGEKALTAVALVFAIFDLNPAPFCLLDEVDAPLDEHNVGRFCDIVREMAQRVQFIFITHNKATMELASQLLGVTMNEPGTSRLVAVDVDEAMRLAAS
jgi:chromosome segregation protein